jgi:acylphosphatase
MKNATKEIQRRVFIQGRVQGVAFRASTLKTVRKYPSIRGFVRNLPDGRVEAVFAGMDTEVLEIVSWCKKGPLLARVTELEVLEESVDSTLGEFEIT